MKNAIMKWLLKLDEEGNVIYKEREVSKFAPINCVLENVGHYDLDSIEVNDKDYLIVTKPKEYEMIKSIILVARIHKDSSGERIIDMSEDDIDSLEAIANRFLREKALIN